MKKRIFMIMMFLLILTGCSETKNNGFAAAKNGVIDLTDWVPPEDGAVKLNGEWAFYWHHLLDPNDDLTSYSPLMIKVPSIWNGLLYHSETLTGEGYATYHLSVRMDVDTEEQLMALYIPTIDTSYRLWVNGQLTAENGTVGTSKQNASPRYKPNVITFRARDNTSILLQIANFSHSEGGIIQEIILGSPDQIIDMKQDKVALNIFVFGSLVIMAFYHIVLFVKRTKDKSSLYFGLLCFIGALRAIIVDQMYLIEWFPNFNWYLALKLEYLTVYFGAFLGVSFIRSMFPAEMNKYIYYFASSVSILFSLFVICFPAKLFTETLSAFEIFLLLLLVYIQYVQVLACIRKRNAALISSITGLIFLGCTINDVLYYAGVIYTVDLLPIGFFLLIISQSVNLSLKFAKSFQRVEQMTKHLEEINVTLEEKVRKRTKDLEQAQFETAAMLAEKSIFLERSRIARELHDILGHMLTTTSVQIEVAKKVVGKDVRLAIDKMDLSQQLIQKGLNDIRGTVHTLKENNEPILFIPSLNKLIEMTEMTTSIKVDSLIEDTVNNLSPTIEKVVYHTLQEGLTNGIRHGGCTKFIFSLYIDSENNLHFSLSDNGVGINELTFGFGLTSIKERLEEQNGKLMITSSDQMGFALEFSIPIV
ncbi:sensor histidine kinase [Alkalihalobacillus sp. AL-G]|uniref:sensor histidine kinase n=1 Tax=Alkalihalobacillus sp. AL-G TaxID=2926399 RepID=UPI00272D7F56|nr:sensor histidine kinase [Alkalihalobacillus sp. AL-G]WLD93836.1 sensor histidine kinase [Alkalihalobacillus sp. AL-G]